MSAGKSSRRIMTNTPISGGAFAQHDRALAHDRQLRSSRRCGDALGLLVGCDREHAGEGAAGLQVRRRGRAVVRDAAAQFEAARDLLRVGTLDAAAAREIRWAAEHQIEALVHAERPRPAQVALADVEAILEPVPAHRSAREPDAFRLRLDADDARPRQPPRRDHRHRADAAAEIEEAAGARAPRRSVPGGENVVGGVAVAFAQLEDFEMPAQGIERFVLADRQLAVAVIARHRRTGDRVAAEVRLAGMIVRSVARHRSRRASTLAPT